MLTKFLVLCSLSLCAVEKDKELAKISEAMGHLIGKNLQALGLPLDVDSLVKGISAASLGKESPLTEEECVEALSNLQDESIAREDEKNLADADEFLKAKKMQEGVIAKEKLLYEIVKQGEGNEVQSYSKPLIRVSGKSLNGMEIPQSEEFIDLDETIAGFQKGLVGMKEGEVRTLYVHPDLAYGKSLLIFSVEVIKADATAEAHAASNDVILPGLD